MKTKNILLTLLLLILSQNFAFSQSDCMKKYPIGALPDDNPCNYDAYTGNMRKYFECVCNSNKEKSKTKTQTNSIKETQSTNINEDYKKTATANKVTLAQQYNDMKKSADECKSNGWENEQFCKDLLNQIKTTEIALNIPRNRRYNNIGYEKEDTDNIYINKANKEINDVKEKTEVIGDAFGNVLGSILSGPSKWDRMADKHAKQVKERKIKDKKAKIFLKNLDLKKRIQLQNINWNGDYRNEITLIGWSDEDLKKHAYKLTKIKYLILENYRGTGLPEEIGKMKNLEDLSISKTYIYYPSAKRFLLPKSMSNLKKLKSIYINSKYLERLTVKNGALLGAENLETIMFGSKTRIRRLPDEILIHPNLKLIYFEAKYLIYYLKILKKQFKLLKKHTSITVKYRKRVPMKTYKGDKEQNNLTLKKLKKQRWYYK